MDSESTARYNEIYRDANGTYRGGKAQRAVVQLAEILGKGDVLDIGGGEGRNALYLAQHGFHVKMVDLSKVGVSNFLKSAKSQGLSVEARVEDVLRTGIQKEYDAIIASYLFHHLTAEESLNLIENAKTHTRVGGINVISLLTKDGEQYRANPTTNKFFPEPDALKEIYRDWEILDYEKMESRSLVKNSAGTPMVNIAAVILAQKKI